MNVKLGTAPKKQRGGFRTIYGAPTNQVGIEESREVCPTGKSNSKRLFAEIGASSLTDGLVDVCLLFVCVCVCACVIVYAPNIAREQGNPRIDSNRSGQVELASGIEGPASCWPRTVAHRGCSLRPT